MKIYHVVDQYLDETLEILQKYFGGVEINTELVEQNKEEAAWI